MNSDDKDNLTSPSEDAFYQADYEEDTIDYDLESDEFLEEEAFEPELSTNWESPEPDTAPELEDEQESDLDLRYEDNTDTQEQWDEGEADPLYDEDYTPPLPLGLFAAAGVALLLLAAGGYGVIQQRTAMQEEIRQLQATLSTSTSNTEVTASRQAQRSLEVRNRDIVVQLEYLRAENQRLRDELSAQTPPPQPKTAEPPKPSPTPKAKPVPVAKVEPTKSSVAKPQVITTGWFVNFGSYTKKAMANSWASKLTADKGEIVVQPSEKGSASFFRVRIINLPSREIAEKIARQLEQTHNLPPLWIGKQ